MQKIDYSYIDTHILQRQLSIICESLQSKYLDDKGRRHLRKRQKEINVELAKR